MSRRARWRLRRLRPGSPATCDRVLVLTTVHQAEDPRIRRRTVAVLARDWPVRYATRPPPPVDRSDHEWRPLVGTRLRRIAGAVREAWGRDVAILSVHDPELVPLAVVTGWLRGTPAVVDVHEDVPAQLRTKPWLPLPARAPAAWLAARMLRAAERSCTITLAEPNYAALFRHAHPVLPNYPDPETLPQPRADDGWFVYVGDVTEARGAFVALEAVGRLAAPRRLRLIGRCAPDLDARLHARARALGVALDLPGFLPHPEAMARVAAGVAGLSPLADIGNYRRSLPTKTLEYLGVGVPVVASDLPGTRAVIGALPGVQLVPPAAADDVAGVKRWADALERVRADASWRQQARAGAAHVRARFAWPAAELRAVYARAGAAGAVR